MQTLPPAPPSAHLYKKRIGTSPQAILPTTSSIVARSTPDNWRLWSEDKGGQRALTTGLGSFLPQYTNGIIVIGSLNGKEFVAHITNVPKLEKTRIYFPRKPSRETSSRITKQRVILVSEDDLL